MSWFPSIEEWCVVGVFLGTVAVTEAALGWVRIEWVLAYWGM